MNAVAKALRDCARPSGSDFGGPGRDGRRPSGGYRPLQDEVLRSAVRSTGSRQG